MKNIIHVQTQVQTVFGELDEDGNVVQTFPVNLAIQKLEESFFVAACEHLIKTKLQLKTKDEKPKDNQSEEE